MNERLRELMVEAGYAAPEIGKRAPKLAELIIRECAGIALQSGNVTNKGIPAKVEAERIYHKINERFGVEQ